MNASKFQVSKKRILFMSLIIVLVAALAACGEPKQNESNQSNQPVEGQDASKLRVVTSIYPIYFLASGIGGEHAEVHNLIQSGVEPHDWTPKSQDLNTASKAQLFLYNGAGLEGWVPNFLQGLSSESKVVTAEVSRGIQLIDGYEHDHEHEGEEEHAHEDEHGHAHEDEEAHGHEDEDGHGHDHETEEEHAHEDEHEHGLEVDPHTWVSPKSAIIMANNIKDSFVQVDSANREHYEANHAQLIAKLTALDAKFATELATTKRKDIVVTHQAFGYLARDYGLNQVSIMGLSADAEPRAQDIIEITKFVKENGVTYIFFEELISSELAEMLAREAKVDTLVLNPLEGLTPQQEKDGEDFISLMEANLQNLMKALQ